MLRAEPAPRVLTVTQLATLVREALEGGVGSVWVAGEISNLRPAPSGHVYFTLKDEQSQLGAVMFRSVARALARVPDRRAAGAGAGCRGGARGGGGDRGPQPAGRARRADRRARRRLARGSVGLQRGGGGACHRCLRCPGGVGGGTRGRLH